MAPLQNFTAPADWFDHGVPGLVCQPATWTSIASFFISNYVAHAFTLKQEPGQLMLVNLFAALAALAYPAFGIARAIRSLLIAAKRPFKTRRTPLERARDAGALCVVVRSSDWRPETGDQIRNLTRSDLVVCAMSWSLL